MGRERDRRADLVLVARQPHAVRAQVAVHAHVAVQRLAVALDHEPGEPPVRADVRGGENLQPRMVRRVLVRLRVDARHEDAGEQEERHDRDPFRAEAPAAFERLLHGRLRDARERRLHQPQPAVVREQPRELVEVGSGVRVRRAAADEHDGGVLGDVAERGASTLLDDVEHDRLDAQIAPHVEVHARMARARARERRGPVVLQVPRGEQHERDGDHFAAPLRDELVDPGVHERLGQLDEPEPDRQLARGLAHVAGERPELLQPVGVAGAVADDHEGR